jgi:hypothetical protein
MNLQTVGLNTVYSAFLTYSMKQSPWEANWFAASQEIPWILWNPKIHSQVPTTCPVIYSAYCMEYELH